MALERGTWLQLQHSRWQLQCDWSLFCQPFLSGMRNVKLFFFFVTSFEVCLLRFSRPCLHLVFLALSILGWRWKNCTSADPVSKIPDVDPFMLTEELSLCMVHPVSIWHIHTSMSRRGYVVFTGPRCNSDYSWILTEVFKVTFTVFDKSGALFWT